ncbi:site-specific integrase [Nibrella saemangeumensis]|uniref:Site-specific integrase n=1 Tax=Nibrella saemangeumensis TaxID=1084526 RepID=A0ABP8MD88_9BACT
MKALVSFSPIHSGISFRLELGNQPKRNGDYAILLRITENRRLKRIFTGLTVKIEHWDAKREEVKRKDSNYIQKNTRLQEILSQVNRFQQDIPNLTSEDLIKTLRGEKVTRQEPELFDYAYNCYLKGKPFNTIKSTTSILNKVKAFTGKEELLFSNLNLDFVSRFEVHLRREYKNNDTTVDINLSKLKAIFNHAVRHQIVSYDINPFRIYRIKEGKPNKLRLTEEEVEQFAKVNLPTHSLLWHTRNYWMFAFYSAGIRFSDVACMSWKNILEKPDGSIYVSYDMQKTGKYHTVRLPKRAIEILNHYRYPKQNGQSAFVFPILNTGRDLSDERTLKIEISCKNALINKYLKKICELAQIDKKVSFHTARHSFADIGRQKASLYDISKLLGHTRLAITEQYFAQKDENAMTKAMVTIFPDE